jgi:Flp pilus assembly protein TadG
MARRSLLRSTSGSAMLEFALLAPIFFLLVTGLVEYVLYQYRTYALNHVVYEAARNLQTGEVQKSGDMAAAFEAEVCDHAGGMIDCQEIVFDVRNFEDLEDVTFPPATLDEDGNPTNFVFQPGGPNRYSVVRAAMRHKFVTPFMTEIMGGGENGAIVNAYCVVRNEPWT